jgi:hypothetical protein
MAKRQLRKSVRGADQLFDRLGAAGTSDNVFTGMIKRAEGDKSAIMFARTGDCSKWIKIPADHVAEIKLIHIASCDGHTHPLVHVFMKAPSSADGKTFAALARLHHAAPRATVSHVAAHPMMGMAAAPPGSTPCYWDWGLNRWVCPS